MLAMFSVIPAIEAAEVIALAGFDVVIVDLEHGPAGPETLGAMIAAAHSRGAYAMVRTRTPDPASIGACLDAGADGVVVPQCTSAETAAAAVAAARFAPAGTRGANPFIRAADFGRGADWYAEANEAVAVVCMVEGGDGLADLRRILAVDGLDAVLVGPVDLSHSLGLPGQVEHPAVLERVGQVIEAAAAAGVAVAVFAPTAALARRWFGLGASLVAVGVDAAVAKEAFMRLAEEAVS
jgi:4-hydroxy-2-oxoheptanedioate aldolase